MTATLRRHLTVATCIGCGARSRAGDCAAGCPDVPLDLVEAADVEACAARLAALEARVAALGDVARALAGGAGELAAVRDQARAALALPLPAPPEEAVAVVEAWGCPDCGRIDAPQPCLGICVRRPVVMADAAEYRALAERTAAAEREERALGALARLAAQVRPHAGHERETAEALAARARAALGGA